MKKYSVFLLVMVLPALVWPDPPKKITTQRELWTAVYPALNDKDDHAHERALKLMEAYIADHPDDELAIDPRLTLKIVDMAMDPKDRNHALATEALFKIIPSFIKADNGKGDEQAFYALLGHPDPKMQDFIVKSFFSNIPGRYHESILDFNSTDPMQRLGVLKVCEIYGAASLFSYRYLQESACQQKGEVQKEALRILAEGKVKVKECGSNNFDDYLVRPSKPLDPLAQTNPRWEKWIPALKKAFETKNKTYELRNKDARVALIALESEKAPCLLLTYTDYEGAGGQIDDFAIYCLSAKGKPVSVLSGDGVLSAVHWEGHSGLLRSASDKATLYLCVPHQLKPVFTFEESDCAWQQGCSFHQRLCEDNGHLTLLHRYEEHEEIMRGADESMRDARVQRASLTWDETKQEFQVGPFETLDTDVCTCGSQNVTAESTLLAK